MVVFRSLHVTPTTIAMVPIHAYINDIRYTPDFVQWLDFVSRNENMVILHAFNSTGEKKNYDISVDGYCLETNTVYQFHGCFYHGCPICYDPDCVHLLKEISLAKVKEKTEMTSAVLLCKGFQAVELSEQEFAKQKKKNPQLQKFLEPHSIQNRLNPTDAFFGGRTNALKLFYKGRVKYVILFRYILK
ncbi:uncharacterized protein CDAR_440401 [Caerostris darwini]|uniref:SWIM-type domain-containing protein n=1 Tax=Caerostris darwini TaxID=1538125 RepID=A0AAV4TVA6_9ARAC|nr:uncharacterized protein CDAR_440401 [Caerostris darwini]